MPSPLLSIAIPTKNREKYLITLVRRILEFNSNNFELVIQDNSDKPSVRLIEMQSKDTRLVYKYDNDYADVSENCERSINSTQGDYVCMLGDDDSICERVLRLAARLKENNIDSVAFNVGRHYWPDLEFRLFKDRLGGFLEFNADNSPAEKVNIGKMTEDFFSSGALDYRKLPRLYHGLVSRESLLKIKTITGSYFPGPSPDMANATALLMVVENHLYINSSFVISGKASKSTGGKGARGEHLATLEEEKSISTSVISAWSPLVPRYWSGSTIWTQSAITALNKMGFEDRVSEINFPRLYASCFIFDSRYMPQIQEAIKHYNYSYPRQSLLIKAQIFFYTLSISVLRVLSIITNLIRVLNLKYRKKKCYAEDSYAVSIEVNKHLSSSVKL